MNSPVTSISNAALRDRLRDKRHARRRAEQPDVDAADGEARVARGDRQVAHRDQLAAGGGGDAVHARDHRHRQALDRQHHAARTARTGAGSRPSDGSARISFRSWPAQKALPAAAITTTRAASSAATRVELRLQRREHRLGQRVEGLRPVQRQRDHAALVARAQHQRFVVQSCASYSIAAGALGRARAAGTSGSCRCRSSGSPRSGSRAAPCSRPAGPCNARSARPPSTVAPALSLDEGQRRLAPFRVGLGHHRAGHHRRVAVQRVLDLDRADVLAAAR